MKNSAGCLITVVAGLLAFVASTAAQIAPGTGYGAGHTIIPQSSQSTAADKGIRSHTNIRIFVPDGFSSSPSELPPFSGYGFETPASLACIYGLVPPVPGCNPNVTTTNPSGGSGAIAIVDAFDDPTAAADLATYSEQFGLRPAKLKVVYAGGSEPAEDPTGGWELEESLDIEMAHAMAPGATIYLVEANSDYDTDLFSAVVVGASLVSCGQPACPRGGHGRGEVSMSWAGSEFSGENSADTIFQYPGVVFVAGSGDDPGTYYPCASPNVICVGGTVAARSIATGNFLYEVAWMDAGGGFSYYESRPQYQNSIRNVVGSMRGMPDVSFEAGANSGVWIYDSNPYEGLPAGWLIAYGTSVGTPAVAAIINGAGHFFYSSASELEVIYSSFRGFTDLQRGYCGPYDTFAASPGWDYCTGVGSPWGYEGK